MDFSVITNDITNYLHRVVDSVLRLNIPPEEKRAQLVRIFIGVGEEFAAKTFNDVSEILDATAIKSQIDINLNNQIEGLVRKIVRDSAFELDDKAIEKEYLDVLLARSEEAAFMNARSLDKHPTLTRRIVGETCGWCHARAGIWEYPDSDLFARHDNCDCLIKVSGYNSRNGTLRNYTKNSRQENTYTLATIFKDPTGSRRLVVNGEEKNKLHEKQSLEWLGKQVGGDFTILKESQQPGVKMPDAIRNSTEIIEIKKFSTRTSLDTRLRNASKQLSPENLQNTSIPQWQGRTCVVILDGGDNASATKLSRGDIKRTIESRKTKIESKGDVFNIDFVVVKRAGKKPIVIRP